MEPMNRFLTSNRQSVKDYIDSVCAIPAESKTFALPASYSTPITILGRLPPTSREGFPSLPYLIDHARNFSALVKLWLSSTEDHGVPQNLEGDLIEFNNLCISLQRRTNDCLHKAESDKPIDNLASQWQEIVEGLENSMLHSRLPKDYDEEKSVRQPVESPPWQDYTIRKAVDQQRPPGSSGSEIVDKERKERQSFWDFSKDAKLQKPYDLTDPSQASPPSRGPSRNEKARAFLPGFRRKGKDGKDREGKDDPSSDKKKILGPG